MQVKALPLFLDKTPLLFNVNGKDVAMESILVYFVDEKAPTITMKPITGGVIAVIVVVILVVLIGLLVLVSKTTSLWLTLSMDLRFRSFIDN